MSKYRSLCSSQAVAPHAGAWIEIVMRGNNFIDSKVAPHAGAWIEIYHWHTQDEQKQSRPTRARGLK